MHGGGLVAKALRANAVTHLFGLCGDHVNAIFDGCVDAGIRIVDTRTEAAAAQMAQGWSLATGSPGVVCVTGGPGLMNAVGTIADCKLAGIPLVVVTSHIRQDEVGTGHPQDMDQLSVVAPIAARAVTVRDPADVPRAVSLAVHDAAERRGPAVLEVPLDVQLARVEDADVPGPPIDAVTAERFPGLDDALRLLATAERPVAILGEGAFWSGADAVAFVEATGVPVFTIRAARGLVPDDHELCLGPLNYLRGPGPAAFAGCDLLLVVGTELDIVLMFGNLAPQATMIRVDADPERVRRHKQPDVAIVKDEAWVLRAVAEEAGRGPDRTGWVKELREAAAGDGEPALDDGAVHPAALARQVARAAGSRCTIALDAGALALWAFDRLPATGPGRMLTTFTTPLATIGPGLPFAMAAKLARPEEPSVALVGDGAFGFSAMELDTASRHGIDIKVVVGDDAAWGIVKRQMELGFGRSVAATLTPRRYDELAGTLGVSGQRIDRGADLPAALQHLMGTDGPALLDVALDGGADHPAMGFIAQMFAPDR